MIIKRRKNRRINSKREMQLLSRRKALYEQAVKVNMLYMEKCFAALDEMAQARKATAILAN